MRRGLQIGLLVSGVIVCVLAGYWLWWALDGGPERGRPSVGGPFELIDGDGRKVTERDFEGRHMLVYFGYTFCPDVCPTTLFNASGALDEIGPGLASKVRLVFISIDPERDTPDIVREYAAHFHPGTVGLTGTPEQVAAAARACRIYYRKAEPEEDGGYLVDHSSILFLMDGDGRYVTHFSHEASTADMAAALTRLISK